ncbi:MAG TPA: hypothetical protein VES73_18765, partial [Lamprocystis sp. (in: g-proteobacteria)]|nr:hypothetical protein [Lamprocystis sp. (in: g-proteobacteria)]
APLQITPNAHSEYRFDLECLPGADAIQVEVAISGALRLRAEVRAQAGEVVRLGLRLDATGEPMLHAGSHQVLFLPVEPAYGPLPPNPIPGGASAWDICLLIDATTRTSLTEAETARGADGTGSRPALALTLDAFLLNHKGQWAPIIARLVELVRHLGEQGQGCRLAVIVVGDEPPPPGVYAADLVPTFHLRHLPDDRPEHLLAPLTPEALAELLVKQIKATPGADVVDALADALAAANQLQWGDETRRLLVIIGDSPGHATAYPVPYGGDALPRRADVDAEAARLHRDHVTIMTLYHAPAAPLVEALLEAQIALIDHAREQYRRLASVPQLACTTTDFDPQEALHTLNGRQVPWGRGASWGRLVTPGEP